jgi:prepilin-type N-terminal cleavage/methylation domain
MVTKREQGFTILELMIATMVFSVVLLLVTAGILQVSRVYYKGLTESTTQSTARNIIDTLAQAIQFSGAEVTETHNVNPGKDDSFCIGNKQYSYRLGSQVMNNPSSSDQAWHALVETYRQWLLQRYCRAVVEPAKRGWSRLDRAAHAPR